jgi:hypothetical protein
MSNVGKISFFLYIHSIIMITLNNSNIDFDFDNNQTFSSMYSILLSQTTSNLIFKTNGYERMAIANNGNVGIGLENPSVPFEVAGNIKASGLITSTGLGFQGKGINLRDIPITGVTDLFTTLLGLTGSNTDVVLNIEETSNNLVNRTLEEILYGSNYTFRINNELNRRTDNTSNYVLSTSNFLVNRIVMEIGRTSNYVLYTSNNLVNRVLEEVNFGSNYLVRMDTNASNYILTTSNILVNRILTEVGFGSNYTNRLDIRASNYGLITSNILVNRIMDEVGFGSNYTNRLDTNSSNLVSSTSNILVKRIVDQITTISTVVTSLDSSSTQFVTTSSNNLVNRIVEEIGFGSNYTTRLDIRGSNYGLITSNILVNRIMSEVLFGSNYTNRLDIRASNYVLITSNILVNRIVDEVLFGSNYTTRLDIRGSNYGLITSNILVNRIMSEVLFGSNYTNRLDIRASNYVLITSNILVNRIVDEVGFGSNYTNRLDIRGSNYGLITSNILVNRIVDEVLFGSNYTNRLDIRGSNYVLITSNILVNRIVDEVRFGSNYARDRVGTWSSNYTDLAGKWGSNYVDRLNAIAMVSSQWTTNSINPSKIFYNTNAGCVGIGTTNPLTNLHIYSSNNNISASSKLIIQESNTSNVFSANITDIISVPSVTPILIEGVIDKYVVYTYTSDNTGTGQTQFTITLPDNYSYDILMVGGGGGGGGDFGAGGGGGAVLYGSNIRIPSGSYNIKVGNGGNGTGQNGYNTEAFNAVCLGGGGAKNIRFNTSLSSADGNSGGSGGGGKSAATGGSLGVGGTALLGTKGSLLGTSIIFGNKGGDGTRTTGYFQSGGGGGAGGQGVSGNSIINTTGTGAGGAGIQFNITGAPLFWGAGGGGGANTMVAGNGGNGGGGAGSGSGTNSGDGSVGGNAYSLAVGMNAASGSGSGGGGGSANFQANGGNGGSGIIIIRYRPIINISGTPEMQLVIGDTISAGASNYKIGNYNGNFQIRNSTSNIDTTSFIIQSSANVGIGTSMITSKLHLYDTNSNAILTLQDNTSVPTLIRPGDISAIAMGGATPNPTSTNIGLYDKQIVFRYLSDSTGLTGQTQFTFVTTEDINTDILVVAGGGAGGCFGGGGGAGQILLNTNYNIPAGTSVIINVGKGGVGGSVVATNGENGFASSITITEPSTTSVITGLPTYVGNTFTANGGGGGGSRNTVTVAGNNGGSGGGSSSGDTAPASLGGISTKTQYPNNWRSFGNSGGIGSYKPTAGATNNHFAGGGGGAGYNGGTGIYLTNVAGDGGVGIDLSSIFGTSVGATGLFGGGGGGMTSGTGTGGAGGGGGGGGGGTGTSSTGTLGTGNTGGGGGGGSITGGNGGSGVVIIRYRQKNREGNSEIQFIKGSSISSGNMNYKMGNYGGDYKIKSSIFNTDTDRFILDSKGDTRFNSTGGITISTIFNNGDIRATGSIISDCDNRIKKDVENIDDENALRMILAVEPKTYRYIDDEKGSRNSGNGSGMGSDSLIYGFIAQQIKNVIPEATEMRKNFLPNIMKRALCDNDMVYLDLTGYRDLPLNDVDRKINIRFKNGGGYNFNIIEVKKEYFVIDNRDKLIEEVFVYGYEVNDFHILTKDYIYTLNVSATQELHRKMERQEERIKELEDKLERILG